jgi:hypothetical protein
MELFRLHHVKHVACNNAITIFFRFSFVPEEERLEKRSRKSTTIVKGKKATMTTNMYRLREVLD